MSYSPQTRIDSTAQGGWTRAEIEAEAKRRGAKRWPDLMDVLDTYYGQSFINPEIAAIQSAHETAWWTSDWYAQRLNLAGIGITGDPTQNNASKTWTNGADAARAHLSHLALYAIGTTLPAGFPGSKAEDPRWDAAVAAGYAGKKQTLASLTNTWAIDSQYDAKLVAILNQREATQPPAGDGGNEQEAPMAGYQTVRFVGLNRDVHLPDDITVHIDIVPDRFCGWVRSCQRTTTVSKTTFHDPGVSGQTARTQRNYLHNGPSENGQRRQVGFNFASDDREIWQITPLDEVTWAAGTATGNRTSWHNEACYGGSINWDRSLRNAIALHAGLIEAMGWQVDTALVKHQYWYGKYCPAQVMNRGLWPYVVAETQRQVNAIKAAKAGVDPVTIAVGATVATTVRLNLRTAAGLGGDVDQVLPAGGEYAVDGGAVIVDGYVWWHITAGEIAGWVAEADTSGTVPYLVVTKAAPEEPEVPEPEYAAPLAIAELAPYVGRPIVPMPYRVEIAGGGVAYPVYDRVRAIRTTPRRQTATGDARVGPDLVEDEEFDVSFLVVKAGQPDTLVTSWWTVIDANDVEIISDVPRDLPAAAEAA